MEINQDKATKELNRLRNRHVAKILNFIGETPPYLEQAIKKQFSMFTEDVENNVLKSEHRGYNENTTATHQ